MQHVFQYELVNPDRTTTRQEWTVMHRWMRQVRNIVNDKINWKAAQKAVMDAMITGTGIYRASVGADMVVVQEHVNAYK